jgi:hypothetical protein
MKAKFVKCAAKDNPVAKKGESYWWWKPFKGSKQYSKEEPKPSQTANNPFTSSVLFITEQLAELGEIGPDRIPAVRQQLSDYSDELRDLAEEQRESRENMPESLRDSGAGELLETRARAADDLADELDELASYEWNADGERESWAQRVRSVEYRGD